MRRAIAVGLGIFGLSMGASFFVFRGAGAAPRMVLQRRAVPPPSAPRTPLQPSAPRLALPRPAAAPQALLPPQPAPAMAPALPADYPAPEPYNPAADPRRPLVDPTDYRRAPARRPRTQALPAGAPQPEPEPPVKPEGFCLVCGAPTDNWVEVDGRKQGYCPKHMSRVKIPIASTPPGLPAAPAPAATGASPAEGPPPVPVSTEQGPAAAATDGPSVQCRGVTKSGTPCRRKTRDPSGLCYQHRMQQ